MVIKKIYFLVQSLFINKKLALFSVSCMFVEQHDVLAVIYIISVVIPKVWVSTGVAVRNICHT